MCLRRQIVARKVVPRLEPCGCIAGLRVSARGLPHFYHRKPCSRSTRPEGCVHLLCKRIIHQSAVDSAYSSVQEAVIAGHCRADVLVSRGSAPIAFEVQWSRISFHEAKRRHSFYSERGIRGCWFFRRLPWECRVPSKRMPAFLLSVPPGAETPLVSIGNRTEGLGSFVRALLTRRVKFLPVTELSRTAKATLLSFSRICQTCRTPSTYSQHLDVRLFSRCGDSTFVHGIPNGGPLSRFQEALVRCLPPALSKALIRSSAYGRRAVLRCDNCGATTLLRCHQGSAQTESRALLEVALALDASYAVQRPHWCMSDPSGNCEQDDGGHVHFIEPIDSAMLTLDSDWGINPVPLRDVP